jgi:hypothetical protein
MLMKEAPFSSEALNSKDHSNVLDATRFTRQQREAADYVCEMILELRNVVLAGQLHELAEYLKRAYYKAYAVSHGVEVSAEQIRHIRVLEKASEESEVRRKAIGQI